MHYERLSRHALRTLPALADIVVALDASRRVRAPHRASHQRAGSTTTAVPYASTSVTPCATSFAS